MYRQIFKTVHEARWKKKGQGKGFLYLTKELFIKQKNYYAEKNSDGLFRKN
jgi:hypothetical protein